MTPPGESVWIRIGRSRDTLRAFFQTFRRTGSATATVKAFRDQQLPFPRRARFGAHQGETLGGRLHSRVLWVLHNPRYGRFFFGRSRQRTPPTRGSSTSGCRATSGRR